MLTRRFPGFLCQIVVACGVVLVGLSSAVAQVAISTLAGSSPAIASGNANAVGTAARFNALSSVAVDSAGNIYVADTSNHTIRKVTAAGVVTTLAGSGVAGAANGTGAAASFRFPQGVATDNTNIYVADTYNHAIRKIVINTGVVTTLAGTVGTSGLANGTGVAATFNNPLGLAVSGTDLYVADTSNHTIRKIVIGTGVVTTFAGTAGTNGFADGTSVAATFKNPGAIAAEGTTNLYVADTANHTIRKIVIGTAAVTTLAGTANATGGSTDATGGAASFKSPGGLVVSGANLFVADTGNNIIRQIVYSTGAVTTIAGTAGTIGTTDAIGTAARFQGPTGIGVSTGGTLYIADTNNHTLRTGAAAAAPTVTNPVAATVAVAANPTFTVTTTGNPTPTIQWERQAANTTGFAAISTSATYTGVGTATLTVTNATLAMSGDQFRASVTNGVGAAVVSAIPATLTVQLASTITSAAAANFAVNTAGTFTVTATGSPAPTFTVPAGTFPSWAALNGTTGVITGTPTNTTGSPFSFTIRASNGVSPVSDQAFVLTVQGTPVITAISAPRQVVTLGENLTLSVIATSGTAHTYQWKRNGLPISGATNATLTLNSVQTTDAGNYDVLVSNSAGSATSKAVTLTVLPVGSVATYAVTTLAGSAGSSGGADGTGSTALFNYPKGVAVDGSGNVFVADLWNQTIRKITAGGVVTTLAGTTLSGGSADGTGSAARFYSPYGVALDGSGNVFVADQANNTIRKITAGGVVTTLAGTAGSVGSADGTGSAARFYNPGGVAADSVGNVFVADLNNHTIRKITAGGVVTTLAGNAGSAGSVDGASGAARFAGPYGVAVDGSGNVFVADSGNHTIRKITASGVVTTLAGLAPTTGNADGTGSAARFDYPTAVAVDGSGNVFVADSGNATIRKITAGGVVTTLAGTARSVGSADGTGSAARFLTPNGVAVDGSGNVFVADSGNH